MWKYFSVFVSIWNFRFVFYSSDKISAFYNASLLGCYAMSNGKLLPMVHNVSNHLPVNVALQSKRPESSVTQVWEPQISQV